MKREGGFGGLWGREEETAERERRISSVFVNGK
jgi:hypothetical protein